MTKLPILTALIHPLNLAMLVLTLFATLLSAWWLLPVGLLFWGLMVFNVARDRSVRLSHRMDQRAPLTQRFEAYYNRIERSQVSIFNTLSSASNRIRKAMEPVQTEVEALTDETYALCRRMTALENYRLVSESQPDLSGDLTRINQVIESTDDALVRREYEESRQALQERLHKLELVSTQLERVEAQLLSLANELDGIVTEVVRYQAVGPERGAARVPELVEKLREERDKLRAFEDEAIRL
ncbi:MAG: hypothetical protein GVY30_03390 [Chloroflexi bacterium]|jgi:chaperonin cofactor prefoldin|nr:hypothetical protein [Chloroflexota bacterium]